MGSVVAGGAGVVKASQVTRLWCGPPLDSEHRAANDGILCMAILSNLYFA